ncbi:MAG TPA: hypothetical protein VFO06_11545 [Gemmatimonadales bacterium]|nr:hypothetical protein [Gemmatimonadales bacterium]
MTSLPVVLNEQIFGIVIRTPVARQRPVRFWAYMWAADEEDTVKHWHERVPVEREAA